MAFCRSALRSLRLGTRTVWCREITATFSTLDAVLLTPLPYDDSERLVIANTTFVGNANSTSSAQDYEDYRHQSDAFEFFALMAGFPMSMAATSGAEAHMADSLWVSWDLFPALRVAPTLGRGFRADEADLDAPAFFVSQRQHEIGVRVALGAKAGRITGLIMKQDLGLVAVGLAGGAATALVGMQQLVHWSIATSSVWR